MQYNTHEFDYIKPTLSCVEWYLNDIKTAAAHQRLSNELADFIESPEVALERTFRWAKKRAEERVGCADDFQTALENVAHCFRHKRVSDASKIAAQQHWIEMILPFCKFDSKAFEKQFRDNYPEINIEKEIADRQKEIAKYTKQRDSLLKKAQSHLTQDMPDPENGIYRFINTWRNRVGHYSIPVTVYGVAISSLPVAYKSIWHTAYHELGFDKVKKRPDQYNPVFVSLPTTIADIPTQVTISDAPTN